MVQEVSSAELEQALAEGAYLVDVREEWEFAGGHAPGAVNVPLSRFVEELPQLPTDRRIFVICQSGGRSLQAAGYLESHDYDAVSVAGGTGGWASSGRPLSKD